MSAERARKLQILVDAGDHLLIRGLAHQYAEAAQETLEALERQLAVEGKAYLVGEMQGRKRALDGPVRQG